MPTQRPLPLSIKRLLFEAYRRNEMADEYERAKPLGDRWLGLGFASTYKPAINAGLMRWANGAHHKRCMGWLTLTPAGVAAYESLIPEFTRALADLKADTRYQRSYASQYAMVRFI